MTGLEKLIELRSWWQVSGTSAAAHQATGARRDLKPEHMAAAKAHLLRELGADHDLTADQFDECLELYVVCNLQRVAEEGAKQAVAHAVDALLDSVPEIDLAKSEPAPPPLPAPPAEPSKEEPAQPVGALAATVLDPIPQDAPAEAVPAGAPKSKRAK